MAMGKINKRKNNDFMPAIPQENVEAKSFLNLKKKKNYNNAFITLIIKNTYKYNITHTLISPGLP